MFKRILMPVALGLGLLVATPLVYGHGGGGHGGGGHGGGGHGGGHAGGGHGGHGHGGHGHGGYYGGFGFYGGFYPGYYNPYSYGYGNGYYNGYATPYLSPTYVVPTYVDPNIVPPMTPPDQLGNAAAIDVTLPRADAKVFVDGNAMTSGNGRIRSFVSPDLEPGYKYSYRVSATWMDNGQQVRVERTVPVTAGRVSSVDFTRAKTSAYTPDVQD